MNSKGKGAKNKPKSSNLVDYKKLERNIVNEISNELYVKKKDKK